MRVSRATKKKAKINAVIRSIQKRAMIFLAPLNNCFACVSYAGMHNVRRLELEKETQNEPIEMNCVLGVLFDFF